MNPPTKSLIHLATFYRLEAQVMELENKFNGIESTSLQSIVEKSYNILKASNKHIKIMITKMEGILEENFIVVVTKDTCHVVVKKDGMGRRTKANTKKMIVGASSNIKQINDVSMKMEVLWEQAMDMIKRMV